MDHSIRLDGLRCVSSVEYWGYIDKSGNCCFDQGKLQQEHFKHAYTDSFFPQQGATLYTIQLGLNLIWMPFFFGLNRPIEATADIVVLTGVTGYLTYIWSKVDGVAAWCLAPYVGWLGFATYLSVCHPHCCLQANDC